VPPGTCPDAIRRMKPSFARVLLPLFIFGFLFTPSTNAANPITVTVIDGAAAPVQLQTTAPTVGEALWEAGYRLYLADQVSPSFDGPITLNLTITIARSHPVTVIADGYTWPTRTHRALVGEILSDVKLALVGDDYVVPESDQPVPAEGVIRLVRVREDFVTAQQLTSYETLYQARDDWEIDTVQVLQAGRQGLTQHRIRVRYEDGLEVTRMDEGERVVQAPTDAVVGYGAQMLVRTLDTPEGPVEYWRSYTMYATSYAAKFLSRPPDSPNYGRTASGKILTKGLVAIDRQMMPFGTRLYVPGYGFAEAADTGGGVRGRWIDLGFDDWNYESWHQVVTVYFLTPVPPADQIRWIIPSTVP